MPLAHPSPAAAHEAEVVLRDGSTAHVRSVLPGDEPALGRFFEALPRVAPPAVLHGGARRRGRGPRRRSAGDQRRLRAPGHARRCDRRARDLRPTTRAGRRSPSRSPTSCRGRASRRSSSPHLAEAAAERGIGVLVADVLPANHEMIAVFRDSGLAIRASTASPAWSSSSARPSSGPRPGRASSGASDDAAAAAVAHVLRPASVAVVGASRHAGTVGGAGARRTSARRLPRAPAPGQPARRRRSTGVPCHPSVLAVPGDVELAVIAVPAAAVPGVARDCAAKGVRALVVVSAGFAEVGGAGGARARPSCSTICRAAGMRLVGPNCLGVLNTDPDVAARRHVRARHAARAAASAFAVAERRARHRRARRGARARASASRRSSRSATRPTSPATTSCATGSTTPAPTSCCSTSSRSATRASSRRIARRVGRAQADRGGEERALGRAGARAAASHTGALLAASDVAVDALFRQAGVIRTDTLGELFDVAALLAHQPLPRGRRVAHRHQRRRPGHPLRRRLRGRRPARSRAAGRHDARAARGAAARRGARGQPGRHDRLGHRRATTSAPCGRGRRRPGVDAVIAIFMPPLGHRARPTSPRRCARGGRAAAARRRSLAVFMRRGAPPPACAAGGVHVPSYAYPEEAARALAHAAAHARWRAEPPGRVPRSPDSAPSDAGGGHRPARWRRRRRLADARRRRGAAGRLRHRRSCRAAPSRPRPAAGAAAAELGGPVALKAVAPRPRAQDRGAARCAWASTAPRRSSARRRAHGGAAARAAAHAVDGLPRAGDGAGRRRAARRRDERPQLRPGRRLRRRRRRRRAARRRRGAPGAR